MQHYYKSQKEKKNEKAFWINLVMAKHLFFFHY